MILSRCSTNFPNTEPMACSYSCDDQTRIHESKEGIPFIALRITLSFLHWIRKSYERLFKTCAHHLRKKNAYISNHHTHWKHSDNLKEKIRKDFWLFHSLAYERLVSRRKEFPWVFSFRVPRYPHNGQNPKEQIIFFVKPSLIDHKPGCEKVKSLF